MTRPFFGPLVGCMVIFAALGPACGAIVFAPLVAWLAAPPVMAAALHVGWLAALIGHFALLIPAYVLGVAPAASAGFLYGLWDYFAPPGWPRWLAGAAFGAAVAHLTGTWIAGLFGGFNVQVWEPEGEDLFGEFFKPEFAAALGHAFDGAGAVAGGLSALVANLVGLTGAKVLEGRPS